MTEEEYKEVVLVIHNALHNKDTNIIEINNKKYPITIAHNGCRKVDYLHTTYMEQNENKVSTTGILSNYAQMARNGDKITWGIRRGQWLLVINNEIKTL